VRSRNNVIASARAFSVLTHSDREHHGRPLVTHLDEVAVLVREFGELYQLVAYLHHILDETEVPLMKIVEDFGSVAADCVELFVTQPQRNPKEQRRLAYAELAKILPDGERAPALVVKAADRLANVQDAYIKEAKGRLRKYRKDHHDFVAAVYRPGLANEVWRELNELVAW
jgi:(p)ppGpp synthase/HD superfamily hydrolase